MGRMRSHRDLEVWKRSAQFAQRIYQVTAHFPDQEKYNLTAQLRRASTSIPANIAEGHGRRTEGAFALHLDIALGSLAEIDTFLYLAHHLGYLSQDVYEELLNELTIIRRMLYRLYNRVQSNR